MNQNNKTPDGKTRPTFIQSLIPLIAIALFLGVGYGVFHLNAEILLIAAATVAGIIALKLGYSYKDIESGIIESMMKGMPAMLIVAAMLTSSLPQRIEMIRRRGSSSNACKVSDFG